MAHSPRAGGEAGSGLLGAGGGLGVKPPRTEEEVGSGGKCARGRALAKQGRQGQGLVVWFVACVVWAFGLALQGVVAIEPRQMSSFAQGCALGFLSLGEEGAQGV